MSKKSVAIVVYLREHSQEYCAAFEEELNKDVINPICTINPGDAHFETIYHLMTDDRCDELNYLLAGLLAKEPLVPQVAKITNLEVVTSNVNGKVTTQGKTDDKPKFHINEVSSTTSPKEALLHYQAETLRLQLMRDADMYNNHRSIHVNDRLTKLESVTTGLASDLHALEYKLAVK